MYFKTVILILAIVASVPAQNYQIDWYVIGSGGGHTESGVYQVDATIGQPIVGVTQSANYTVEAGYWVGAGPLGPILYPYLTGDVNMYNGIWPAARISGDVTYLVGFLRQAPTSLPCMFVNLAADPAFDTLWASADANGNCGVNSGDVTKLVNVFRGQATTLWCGYNHPGEEASYYEPTWYNNEEVIGDPPEGWTGPGYGGGPNQICDNVEVQPNLKIISPDVTK